MFPELLKLLGGSANILGSDLRLGHLLPQILPGHRLWCYATGRVERFLPSSRKIPTSAPKFSAVQAESKPISSVVIAEAPWSLLASLSFQIITWRDRS